MAHSKSLKRWPRMQGLRRRPKVGDVFTYSAPDGRGKRIVIQIRGNWITFLPYDEPKPAFVMGSLQPHALGKYVFLKRAFR